MSDISFLNNGQWTLDKSNYGPKGAKLYNIADNARRKMTNTGETRGIGPNVNVKEYGGFGGAKMANIEAARIKRINRKQPVKVYTPEEIEAYKQKRAVNKCDHLKIAKNGQWSLGES